MTRNITKVRSTNVAFLAFLSDAIPTILILRTVMYLPGIGRASSEVERSRSDDPDAIR
jgi:hypothetical protein